MGREERVSEGSPALALLLFVTGTRRSAASCRGKFGSRGPRNTVFGESESGDVTSRGDPSLIS